MSEVSSGDDLTPELVERVGKAATLWAGGGRVLVGRDTRGSGPELEEAVARGIASAGGTAVLAGVLPTPAVALLAEELGVVVSASHNPPEYNGVKLFRPGGKLVGRARRRQIEALLDAPAPGGGSVERARRRARGRYSRHVVEHFGSDLTGLRDRRRLRERRVLGASRRGRSERSARRCTRSASSPTARTSTSAAARPISRPCRRSSSSRASTSESRSTGTATACSPSTSMASVVDGDQILAMLALAPRRRRRRGHGHDEPRLPPAHGGAPRQGRHDAGRRPLRPRGAASARAGSSAASSPATSSGSATTSRATASPRRCSSAARSAGAR